jgi:hypothetical protein
MQLTSSRSVILTTLSTLILTSYQGDIEIDPSDVQLSEEPSLEFLTPLHGDEVLFTPFRVEVRINGDFQVPEDGELQIAMTYLGRGTQVRVLQSLYFMCWNVGDSEVEIRAQLVTTRDVPVGQPTSIRVRQRPGPHFVLSSPSNGQIFVAQR